jgi:hypothetical protein
MKGLVAIVLAAVMIAMGAATPALARQTRDFEAELHHFSAPAGSCEAGVCDYVTYGYGFTNLMGPVTVTIVFTWDFTTAPCSTLDPLVFTLVGATGSMTISGSGVVCTGRGLPQFFTGAGQVTGGTGEFRGISGSVTTWGTLTNDGPVVHMSGTASY